MELDLREEHGTTRFVVTNDEPWVPATFFAQLDRMSAKLMKALRNPDTKLLFDFSRAEHLDSSIISLLVQAVRMAGSRRVSIVTPHSETANLLHLMGIDKLADVHDSLEDYRESV